VSYGRINAAVYWVSKIRDLRLTLCSRGTYNLSGLRSYYQDSQHPTGREGNQGR
jgi:hypothetical protein